MLVTTNSALVNQSFMYDDLIILRLFGSLGHGGQKMVLGTSLPEFNPDKFPLL
jgi:hypothetical protein